MICSEFIESGHHHQNLVLEYFPDPQKVSHVHLKSLWGFLLPPPVPCSGLLNRILGSGAEFALWTLWASPSVSSSWGA